MAGTSFAICTYSEAWALAHQFGRAWVLHKPDDADPEQDTVYFGTPPALGRVCYELGWEDLEDLIDRARDAGLVCLVFRRAPSAIGFRGLRFTRVTQVVEPAAAVLARPRERALCLHCGRRLDLCQDGETTGEAIDADTAEAPCHLHGLNLYRCPIGETRPPTKPTS